MTDPRAEQLDAIADAREVLVELYREAQDVDDDDLPIVAGRIEGAATELGLAAAYPGGALVLGHLAGEADAIRRTWELGYIALIRVRALLTYALETADDQLAAIAQDVAAG